MIDLFRELENRLLRQEIRHSPAAVSALLADDFLEFGSSGNIYGRRQTIDALEHEPPAELSMADFAVRALSDSVVLVTYRSERRDPVSGLDRHSLRSSIWSLIGGTWKLRFHQGTPLAKP